MNNNPNPYDDKIQRAIELKDYKIQRLTELRKVWKKLAKLNTQKYELISHDNEIIVYIDAVQSLTGARKMIRQLYPEFTGEQELVFPTHTQMIITWTEPDVPIEIWHECLATEYPSVCLYKERP